MYIHSHPYIHTNIESTTNWHCQLICSSVYFPDYLQQDSDIYLWTAASLWSSSIAEILLVLPWGINLVAHVGKHVTTPMSIRKTVATTIQRRRVEEASIGDPIKQRRQVSHNNNSSSSNCIRTAMEDIPSVNLIWRRTKLRQVNWYMSPTTISTEHRRPENWVSTKEIDWRSSIDIRKWSILRRFTLLDSFVS